MNQKELVQAIARLTHLPKVAISDVLRTAGELVSETLSGDESVSVPGFGKFKAQRSATRSMKMLNSDEVRVVGGRRRARFLPSQEFQATVRGEF